MNEALLQLIFLVILIVLGLSGLALLVHGVYDFRQKAAPKPQAEKVEFPKQEPPKPKPDERAA